MSRGRAEEIRLRYLYRDLILRGRVALPRRSAVKLVGPDCAYHLYRVTETVSSRARSARRRSPRPPRTRGD